MLSRLYRMQEIQPGLTSYLMHYLPDEPGYQALQYVDVVHVDENYVFVSKHSGNKFFYSNGRPGKDFLKLKKTNYDVDWYLSRC